MLMALIICLWMPQVMTLKWMAWWTLRSWGWLPKKSVTSGAWRPSTWTQPSCSEPGRGPVINEGSCQVIDGSVTFPVVPVSTPLTNRLSGQPVHIDSVRFLHHAFPSSSCSLWQTVSSSSCFLIHFVGVKSAHSFCESVFVQWCLLSVECYHCISFLLTFLWVFWWNCLSLVILVVFPVLRCVSSFFSLYSYTLPPSPPHTSLFMAPIL